MYQSHSATSRNAWETLDTAEKSAEKVYKAIEAAGVAGICAPAVADALDMQAGTVAARVIGLERDKRIVRLAREVKSPSGKPANVLVADRYVRDLAPGETILPTKAEGKTKTVYVQDPEAKAILEEVENLVALGSPILYDSALHKRIKAFNAK